MRRILVLTAIALLAGCSQAGDPGTTSVRHDEAVYPLDAYQAMGSQRVAIETANAVMIQRCLKRHGIDVPLGSPEKAAQGQQRPNWYGQTNEGAARTYGYSGALPPVAEQDKPFIRRIPRSAQPLVTGDAPGSPEGGCQGESNRVITGGSPAVQDDYLVRKLEKEAVDQAKRDNQVAARIKDWQACLKQDFPDPMAPYAHWNGKRPKGTLTVSPEESAMAVADVKCKRETGLLDAWAGATIVHQRELVDRNADQLRLHQQRLERNVRNAEQVSGQPRG